MCGGEEKVYKRTCEVGILIAYALCLFLEFGESGIGPPIDQLALAVELSAFVIKSVAQFVPDDHPYTSIVHRVEVIVLEERRLHDARRENDLIEIRAIICIHIVREHLPLRAIGRFAHLGKLFLSFDLPVCFGKKEVSARVKKKWERDGVPYLTSIAASKNSPWFTTMPS